MCILPRAKIRYEQLDRAMKLNKAVDKSIPFYDCKNDTLHLGITIIGVSEESYDVVKYFEQNIFPQLKRESESNSTHLKAVFICDDIGKNIVSVVSDNSLNDMVFLVADYTNDGELSRAKEIINSTIRRGTQLIIGIEINPDAKVKMLEDAYDVLSFGMDILLPFNRMAVSRNNILNDKERVYLATCQPIKMIIAAIIPGLVGFSFDEMLLNILSKAGVAHYIYGSDGEDACHKAVRQALDSYSVEFELTNVRRALAIYVVDPSCSTMYSILDSLKILSDNLIDDCKICFSAGCNQEMEADKVEFLAIFVK